MAQTSTPKVDTADFMMSEPEGAFALAGGDGARTILTPAVEDAADQRVVSPPLVAPARSVAAEVGVANASPLLPSSEPGRAQESPRPTASMTVPVAVRSASTEPTTSGRRRGRRKREAADVPSRTPEEWVLDPGEFTQLPDRPYQELWFELRTWTWKSLAVVPTVSGCSELDVAEKLVVVGVSNSNRRMSLISAEGVSVADTDRVIAMIRAAEARGDRVIVCTDSIQDNPAAAPIIRAVNGAVLSVRLGRSEKTAVERTISTIHRNRVLGVITRRS